MKNILTSRQIFPVKFIILGLLSWIIFTLDGCSEMQQLIKAVDVKKPTAKISNVKITALSLDQADLLFDIKISNPNSININLAGFDYDLLLNKASFLKGTQNKTVNIAAHASSKIQLPLSLRYEDIYKTFKSLSKKDKINYVLKLGLSFDLPVLGTVRVPIETKGSVPTIKLPAVSVKALKLNNLAFTGADLQLNLQIKNPNTFALNLNHFNYAFVVDGQKWIEGQEKKQISVSKKGKKTLSIPIKLNFLEIGHSVMNLISGSSKLNYKLSGKADVGSSLKILKNFPFDFDYEGQVKLKK